MRATIASVSAVTIAPASPGPAPRSIWIDPRQATDVVLADNDRDPRLKLGVVCPANDEAVLLTPDPFNHLCVNHPEPCRDQVVRRPRCTALVLQQLVESLLPAQGARESAQSESRRSVRALLSSEVSVGESVPR